MSLFITFEGIEGCGKTTQIRRLAKRIEAAGKACVLTREPGGCPIADQIRSILLSADNRAMVPLAELLLYAAARAQHVTEVIAPALARGDLVLCDRFTDATLAYQGAGRGLDPSVLHQLNSLATGDVTPHVTILIDCPVEVGLGRATARINSTAGAREERFELESRLFHERVRDGYLLLARQEPERFIIIDGTNGIEETETNVWTPLLPRLTKN